MRAETGACFGRNFQHRHDHAVHGCHNLCGSHRLDLCQPLAGRGKVDDVVVRCHVGRNDRPDASGLPRGHPGLGLDRRRQQPRADGLRFRPSGHCRLSQCQCRKDIDLARSGHLDGGVLLRARLRARFQRPHHPLFCHDRHLCRHHIGRHLEGLEGRETPELSAALHSFRHPWPRLCTACGPGLHLPHGRRLRLPAIDLACRHDDGSLRPRHRPVLHDLRAVQGAGGEPLPHGR